MTMQNIASDKTKIWGWPIGLWTMFVLQGMNMKGGEFDELQYASSKLNVEKVMLMHMFWNEIYKCWNCLCMTSQKRKACSNSNEQNVKLQKRIIIIYMEQGLEKENALIQQKLQGKGEANVALTT